MTLKFYLHDATTADTGTLPGSTNISGQTVNITATGAATNRSADDAIGASQVSIALSTVASTSAQTNWFARFCSIPLAAQTIASQNVTVHLGASESNNSSNLFPKVVITVWRPSTGATVGTLATLTGVTEPGTNETDVSVAGTSTAITVALGDILVIEVFGANTQAMGTSYTNTIFYDGTTEASSSSNAAYVAFVNDVALAPRTLIRTASDSIPIGTDSVTQVPGGPQSRSFNGTSDHADASSVPYSADSAVFSVVGWLNVNSVTGSSERKVFTIQQTTGETGWWLDLSTTGAVEAMQNGTWGGTNPRATGSVLPSSGTWHHVAAVFNGGSDRSIYLDGANKVQNLQPVTFGGPPTQMSLAYDPNGGTEYFGGLLGYWAVYSIALSATDVASLAGGATPDTVQGASLVAYWKLTGENSPEPDQQGTYPLTLTGTTKGSSKPPISAGTLFTRTVSDTIALVSDSAARVISFVRTASESIASTDSLARAAMAKVRTAADTIASSDAVVAGKTLIRTATDTIAAGASTAARGAVSFARVASDTITGSDSAQRASAALSRTVTDTIAIGSSLATGLKVQIRSAVDSIPLVSDGVSRVGTFARSAADTIAGSDSVARAALALLRSATDSVPAGVSTAARAALALVRVTSDTVTGSDAAQRAFTGVRTATDTIALGTSTAARAAATFVRAVADSSVFSDSVVAIKSGAQLFVRTAVDTVALGADSISRAFSGVRSMAEAVPTTDAVVRVIPFVRTITDTIALGSSAATRTLTAVRNAADAIATSDAVVRVSGKVRTLVDSVPIGSSVTTRVLMVVRPVTDSVPTTDAVSRVGSFARTVTDTLTTTATVVALAHLMTRARGATASRIRSVSSRFRGPTSPR